MKNTTTMPQTTPPRRKRLLSPLESIIAGAAITIFMVGLISLLIFVIYWLVFQPRKLRYSIETGFVSGYNVTNDQLNANFHFVLRVNNRNKWLSLYYDRIDVAVLYKHQKLSVNSVNPFYQPRRNVTNLDLDLVAKNAALYGAVARDLRMEEASADVKLNVKIRARIRLEIDAFMYHRKLKVACGELRVPFSLSSGFERVHCHADINDPSMNYLFT